MTEDGAGEKFGNSAFLNDLIGYSQTKFKLICLFISNIEYNDQQETIYQIHGIIAPNWTGYESG